ncbi:MAG: glyoxalase [Archangium gephyra]|uniref:Glyoxalase n=1 Tax=Archangium gephyra TaxID=48 RepID=A0A2W5TSV7_9BACT|nr:MAG: glyoxalase [Archangium gephyra]
MKIFCVIDVPDMERSVNFYTEGIGLTLYKRYGDDFVELHGGPMPIHLLTKKAGTETGNSKRTYERHSTPVHLDFVTDDLLIAAERAVAAGAKLEAPITERNWGRMGNFADPFGHGFCILQMKGKGYDEPA